MCGWLLLLVVKKMISRTTGQNADNGNGKKGRKIDRDTCGETIWGHAKMGSKHHSSQAQDRQEALRY